MSTLRIGTYNLGDGPGPEKVDDLLKISPYCDVLTLCEASDRRQEIHRFLEKRPLWDGYFGDGSDGADATPILWNSMFRLTDSRTTQAVPERFVGPAGAGPPVIKRKVVNRVRLTGFGHLVHAISVHTLPSATRNDLPPSEEVRRRDHYSDHMHAVAGVVRLRGGLVFVSGDFNAESDFHLLDPLREVGLACDSVRATLGPRGVDMVWHRRNVGLHRSDEHTVNGSSNHDADVVSYRLAA